MMKTDYGQAWLKFYIHWRFPIGLILGAVGLINDFAEASQNGYWTWPLFIVLLALDIAMYIFVIVVYVNMLSRSPRGYYLNNVLIVVESVYRAFVQSLSTANSTPVWIMFPILTLIMGLIWIWPNLVYFKHRKYLFGILTPGMFPENTSKTTDKAPVSEGTATPLPAGSAVDTPIQFCRICGAKLSPGAAFCSECGTKILPSPVAEQTIAVTDEPLPAPPKRLSASPSQDNASEKSSLFSGKGLPPILRRAFLLIEDEEWEKADAYVERVLDEDPENAFAYLAKLMIEFKTSTTTDLTEVSGGVSRSRNFLKALRYAEDSDLVAFLSRLN